MTNLEARVSITRRSTGEICITIEDVASHVLFAEVLMKPEDFGNCVTGLSSQDAKLKVRGLEFIGKKRITERRQVECPIQTYDTDTSSQWLDDNAQEEGWILNTYLGSKSSVVRLDDKTTLNYSVTKYVDQEAS